MSSIESFGQRKKDHIKMSLDEGSQAIVDQFSAIELQHHPLPDINFESISLKTAVFGNPVNSPLFVSSMTLGHNGAQEINLRLGKSCVRRGWMMGVGSQRRQLFDPSAAKECELLREQFPELVLFGNIGLAQVIGSSPKEIQKLVDALGAQFLVVHTNPLQEVIQREGTPQFAGGSEALKILCQELKVPVVLKETGSGFSSRALGSLCEIPLGAVDVSGMGGTHWGRVEGMRESEHSLTHQLAQTFGYWGISTVDSLLAAKQCHLPFPVWASGGIRSGLDGAKAMALGAEMVGFARPVLEAAILGEKELDNLMVRLEKELRTAMFCLGCKDINALVGDGDLWIKK